MRSKEYERRLLARFRKTESKKHPQIHTERLPELNQRNLTYTKLIYEKEFSDILFKMLKQGYTVKDFYNEIGIHRSKFYRWLKRYPEFAQAFREGREAAKEIWQLRCKIPFHNPETGKRLPNTSYHRLLASNIYGRDFIPPKKKLSKEANQIAELKRILLNYGR